MMETPAMTLTVHILMMFMQTWMMIMQTMMMLMLHLLLMMCIMTSLLGKTGNAKDNRFAFLPASVVIFMPFKTRGQLLKRLELTPNTCAIVWLTRKT